jgi:hypothetical protein
MTELDQALATARSLSPDLQEEPAAVGRISADRAHAEAGHYVPCGESIERFDPQRNSCSPFEPLICSVSRKTAPRADR